MQIAVCLLPERELAAELVVFTQMHASALGGAPLSLTTNRPRLTLCAGELDEWTLTPDLLGDLAPASPIRAHFGELTRADDGTLYGPLVSPGKDGSRALIGLQARATVRLGLQLPARWIPGVVLGHTDANRPHPALRSDWATTMAGREVLLNRLGFLRLDAEGRAVAALASTPLEG